MGLTPRTSQEGHGVGPGLLGKIMDYIEQAAKMFSFVLKIIAEIVGYFFRVLIESVKALVSTFVSIVEIDDGFAFDVSLSFFNIDLSLYVAYMQSTFGFEIPFLVYDMSLGILVDGASIISLTFLLYISSLVIDLSLIHISEPTRPY